MKTFATAIPLGLMLTFAVSASDEAREQGFFHTYRECMGTTEIQVDFAYGSANGVIYRGFRQLTGTGWDQAHENHRVAWIEHAETRLNDTFKAAGYKLPAYVGPVSQVATAPERAALEKSIHGVVQKMAASLHWPSLFVVLDKVRFAANAKSCPDQRQAVNINVIQ